jgi:Asp-tRNA(Asn)/Glu-tRNA(Gln) amidotransferase A subunit family amidase
MPTQYNSRLYESEDPVKVDANCVMTLRASGALIFGKTSTTEFATSKQGNFHQNLTSNAHDPKRTPGGSSSGSGAAVGDFQVPIALGTQVCQSNAYRDDCCSDDSCRISDGREYRKTRLF